MTARDDLLERLVDAQVRVIRADEACRGAANIKQHCEETLLEARRQLQEALGDWMAADSGPERDGLTWTPADEAAVAEFLVPEQRDGRADD